MAGRNGNAQDTFASARERMVQVQLKNRGIKDQRVLDAMSTVPRERFVPEGSRRDAYADRPLPIGRGQTISQPYMVARMLEALAPGDEHRTLEIGAGSGYVAALLGELCAEVWAVEIVEKLVQRARGVLLDLGYENVNLVVGDGTQGLAERAPYDRIIVSAGAPSEPQPLLDQLADGGRLVMPVGNRISQHLVTVDRDGDQFNRSKGMSCVFVPLVGRHGWSPGGQ